VELYNSIEKSGMAILPFTCREAWAAHLWGKIGFPVSINSLEEVKFCSDNMQYHRIEQICKNLSGMVSASELEDAREIMLTMSEIFGKDNRAIPFSSILNAVYQLRVIKQAVPNARSMFEIGPGPGYLAGMAVKRLERVACLESVQAFYLHQNLLFSKMGKLRELANSNPKLNYCNGKIEHIPWWIFADKYDLNHDIIFGGHVVCEMSERSLRQVLSRAVASNLVPAIIFESTGDQRLTPMHSRISLIQEYGFVKVLEQFDLYIFVHPNSNPVIKKDIENFTFRFGTAPTVRKKFKIRDRKKSGYENELNFYELLMRFGREKEKFFSIEYIEEEYKKLNGVNLDMEFLSGIMPKVVDSHGSV